MVILFRSIWPPFYLYFTSILPPLCLHFTSNFRLDVGAKIAELSIYFVPEMWTHTYINIYDNTLSPPLFFLSFFAFLLLFCFSFA